MSLSDDHLQANSFISGNDLLKIIPISRNKLWELTTDKNEALRIPSYKVGRKRLYKLNEVMWWLEKHKYAP